MKIKVNDNLIAIYTYIQSNPEIIDLMEFMQWVFDYEYYKELYINWHIIYDLIKWHNNNLDLVKKHIYEKGQ